MFLISHRLLHVTQTEDMQSYVCFELENVDKVLQSQLFDKYDKYNGFRCKSQEKLSSMIEKSLKSSKIEMYSWPPRSYGQL
jgi:hypothetical protein